MRNLARRLVIIIPYLWLAAFFLWPMAIVLKIALSEPRLAQPPYWPLLDLTAGWEELVAFFQALSFENFVFLAQDDLYIASLISSLRISLISTAMLLAIGFPIAHAMARAPRSWRPILVAAMILPFWTSFLIRVYAWIGILRPEGFLNHYLQGAGLISQPLTILNTEYAVFHRAGLYLPALHGAAALCHAGADGSDADRGRARSRRVARQGVLERDGAARQTRHHRGIAAVLSSRSPVNSSCRICSAARRR